MKVLFSSNKNPHFITITEYIEKALKEEGCQTIFFNNRDFIIPGRIRKRISYFDKVDLRRINRGLIATIISSKPNLFLSSVRRPLFEWFFHKHSGENILDN